MTDTANLIKKINKKLIDLNLYKHGKNKTLAKAIGVDVNSLSMALTGYRQTKRSKEILLLLLNYTQKLSKSTKKVY